MTEFIITCQSELQKDGSYKIERYRELVRCKDCNHESYCSIHETKFSDDWFCADGVKKDGY